MILPELFHDFTTAERIEDVQSNELFYLEFSSEITLGRCINNTTDSIYVELYAWIFPWHKFIAKHTSYNFRNFTLLNP